MKSLIFWFLSIAGMLVSIMGFSQGTVVWSKSDLEGGWNTNVSLSGYYKLEWVSGGSGYADARAGSYGSPVYERIYSTGFTPSFQRTTGSIYVYTNIGGGQKYVRLWHYGDTDPDGPQDIEITSSNAENVNAGETLFYTMVTNCDPADTIGFNGLPANTVYNGQSIECVFTEPGIYNVNMWAIDDETESRDDEILVITVDYEDGTPYDPGDQQHVILDDLEQPARLFFEQQTSDIIEAIGELNYAQTLRHTETINELQGIQDRQDIQIDQLSEIISLLESIDANLSVGASVAPTETTLPTPPGFGGFGDMTAPDRVDFEQSDISTQVEQDIHNSFITLKNRIGTDSTPPPIDIPVSTLHSSLSDWQLDFGTGVLNDFRIMVRYAFNLMYAILGMFAIGKLIFSLSWM
jgi:hypothetical protein